MKNRTFIWLFTVLLGIGGVGAVIQGCGGGGSVTTSSSATITGQALNANETNLSSVSTAYGGTCEKVTRDTTSCQSAREALGLTGNWLSFSCNVVLGLATSGGAATTTYADAAYVTVTIVDLPDYASNYFSTSGSYDFTANGTTVAGTYDSMYSAYTTTFPDPSSIASQSIVMNIPLSPTEAAAKSQTMSGGIVGVSINGIGIYDNLANDTDNIFAEAGSFDQCQGHPANGQYHYHSEPYSISYIDTNLIGVMRDGFFIYGREDSTGTVPGSTANQLSAGGQTSNIYVYGGHVGTVPTTGTGSIFHYHLTEWEGCYHESGGTKSADDGIVDDSYESSVSSTCTSDGGTWVDAWFLTGHGNGGVFMTTPTGLTGETPSQATPGTRYYYGTPGTCTGCTG